MSTEKLVIAAFRDPDQANQAGREMRLGGFRDDQLVFALTIRRSDRKGLLTHALLRHGATIDTCTQCEQFYAEGYVVIAVRSRARKARAAEIMVRNGGELKFDGDAQTSQDAEPGQGQGD